MPDRDAVIAPEKHGKHRTYTVLGCRCAKCRAAHAEYTRRWQAANQVRRHAYRHDECPDCGEEKHVEATRCAACEKKRVEALRLPCGTRASYARGCRCDSCRTAVAAYNRQFKQKGVAT